MSDKDQIKELFSEKLGGYEAKVNPELWTNIASQVGTTTSTAASAGMSLMTKILISVSAASIVTTGVVLYVNSNSDNLEPKQEEVNKVTDLSDNDQSSKITLTKSDQHKITEDIDVVSNNNSSGDVIDNDHVISPVNDPIAGVIEDDSEQVNFLPPSKDLQINNELDRSTEQSISEKEEEIILEDDIPERLSLEDEPTNHVVFEEKDEETVEFTFDLPNVITPNGDRANDVFSIEISEDLVEFQVVVLNRAGQKVFESQDPNFIWDGQHMVTGELLQGKGFVYFVIATNNEDITVRKSQNLSIYR